MESHMAKYSLESYSQMMLDDCIALLRQYPAARVYSTVLMSHDPDLEEAFNRQLDQHPKLKTELSELLMEATEDSERSIEAQKHPYYSYNIIVYLNIALTNLDKEMPLKNILSSKKTTKPDRVAHLQYWSTITKSDAVDDDEQSRALVNMFIKHNKALIAEGTKFTGKMGLAGSGIRKAADVQLKSIQIVANKLGIQLEPESKKDLIEQGEAAPEGIKARMAQRDLLDAKITDLESIAENITVQRQKNEKYNIYEDLHYKNNNWEKLKKLFTLLALNAEEKANLQEPAKQYRFISIFSGDEKYKNQVAANIETMLSKIDDKSGGLDAELVALEDKIEDQRNKEAAARLKSMVQPGLKETKPVPSSFLTKAIKFVMNVLFFPFRVIAFLIDRPFRVVSALFSKAGSAKKAKAGAQQKPADIVKIGKVQKPPKAPKVVASKKAVEAEDGEGERPSPRQK